MCFSKVAQHAIDIKYMSMIWRLLSPAATEGCNLKSLAFACTNISTSYSLQVPAVAKDETQKHKTSSDTVIS